MSNYKKPGEIPPFVAASVGKSPKEKLKLIDLVVFDLCKYIEQRGYSFKGGHDAVKDFFSEDKQAPKTASDLMRHLLGIVMAEELMQDRGLLAPNNVAGKKQNFRNN